MLKSKISPALAMLILATAIPVHAADSEVEALKQELAAQRKLIERLLANQDGTQRSPTTAAEVEQRLKSGDKAAISSPAPVPAPAPGVPLTPALKFYGVADVAVVSQDTGYGRKLRIDGGGANLPSRLGVQATKTLGAVKLTAVAEAGVEFDNGGTGGASPTHGINDTAASSGGTPGTGSQVFARQIWAGIDAGFGQISIGRQYSGSYITVAVVGSAHGDGLYGNTAGFVPVVGGMPSRVNNSLIWSTPQVSGLRGIATYMAGSENNVSGAVANSATTMTSSKAGQGFDLAGIYSYQGGQAALTGWNYYNGTYVTAGETALAKKKGIQFAANYDLGPVKVFADFMHGTIDGGNYQNVTKALSAANGYGVSVLVPFGRHRVVASVTHVDDKSLLDRDATLYGLSYIFEYSADAQFYAALGRMSNNRNASYSLTDGANIVGNVARGGFSPSGFESGMSFKF